MASEEQPLILISYRIFFYILVDKEPSQSLSINFVQFVNVFCPNLEEKPFDNIYFRLDQLEIPTGVLVL